MGHSCRTIKRLFRERNFRERKHLRNEKAIGILGLGFRVNGLGLGLQLRLGLRFMFLLGFRFSCLGFEV